MPRMGSSSPLTPGVGFGVWVWGVRNWGLLFKVEVQVLGFGFRV